MAINVFVQYNGEFPPDILLLTQAPIVVPVWFNGTIIVYSIITTLSIIYYIVFSFVLFGGPPCMAINVSVQYNGGLLPDIILLTQPMLLPSGNPFKCHEEVLSLQPTIPPRCFDMFPPDWGMLRRS